MSIWLQKNTTIVHLSYKTIYSEFAVVKMQVGQIKVLKDCTNSWEY